MNVMNQNQVKRWAAPLAGILSILAVSTSQAALVAPGGGFTNLAGTTNFGGTVVGNKTVGFIEPSALFQGTLRSVVVQNSSGLLDFYFQIANTSNLAPVNTPAGGGADIFRLAVLNFNGFGTGAGDSLEVNYVTNGLTGIAGAGAFVTGTKLAVTGDRLPTVASNLVGFDFDTSHFLGGPGNVDSGQTSDFLLIRTNARFFQNVNNEVISSFGTAFASGFAPVPVPEPATLLAGLVLGSFVAIRDLGRGRRRQSLATQA